MAAGTYFCSFGVSDAMNAKGQLASQGALRQKLIASYVSSSPGVHQRADVVQYEAYERAYAKYLKGWIPLENKGRWLDLGCGQGGLLRLARSMGFVEVRGVDQSEEMVDICRQSGLLVEHGEALQYVSACESQGWEIVSAFDLLEHLSRDDGYRLLCEIHRVLVAGGVCMLKVPNGDSPWSVSIMSSDLTHETLYSPESLEQMSCLAGFVGAELREVGPVSTGLLAATRKFMWSGIRAMYRFINLVETGSAGRGINTRIMMARLHK